MSNIEEIAKNLRLYAQKGEASKVRDFLQANAGNFKNIINRPDGVRGELQHHYRTS
jgi:hypothetical protein